MRAPELVRDCHEALHPFDDPDSGLNGVIAIHSAALGPAAGGCRLWTYAGHLDLVHDAMRLAQGMSYKNAMAGLPFGGGKAVIQRPRGAFDRTKLFEAFGRVVASLKGEYVTAEDVGTTIADMGVVRTRTRHVAGLPALPGRAGGDPSLWTARGVFLSIEAALAFKLDRVISGATVAVQGLGSVGSELCRLLHEAGARLVIADTDGEKAQRLARLYGAAVCAPGGVHRVEADVFAPCALGGVLSRRTIAELRSGIVCGAANNQLESTSDGEALRARGVLYCPDYVVNAGGIINVAAEYLYETNVDVEARVGAIPARLRDVLLRAEAVAQPTALVADMMACELIVAAPRRLAA
jgi:leucine dehydrogenase